MNAALQHQQHTTSYNRSRAPHACLAHQSPNNRHVTIQSRSSNRHPHLIVFKPWIIPSPRSIRRRPSCPHASADSHFGPAPDSQSLKQSFLGLRIFNTEYDNEIISLALPALFSMLLDPIMGAVNTALVGHLGTHALASTSIGAMIITFAALMFSFMLFLTTPKVAAAVAMNDTDAVSKTASQGLWVSAVCGILMSCFTFFNAGNIIAVFNPPEAAVAANATLYIMGRSLGLTATLFIFTCSGIYRGFKDTRTPMYASAATAATSLALNIFFIYGLKLGVLGAALSTSIANWVSCSALLYLLIRKGRVKLADLLQPPSMKEVAPMLRSGFLLSARSIVSFGLVLYASTLCVRAGSAVQGSFEVVRQLWILTIQFFECLNVACQALCAAYLGAKDSSRARDVLMRISLLGTLSAVFVGTVLFSTQEPIVKLFTKDAMVISEVARALPMVCCLFPLDAIASILDGSLFAAQQTDYLTYVQILGSTVQYAALTWVVTNNAVSALSIWGVLKLLTVVRLCAGFYRVFISEKSAYRRGQLAAP